MFSFFGLLHRKVPAFLPQGHQFITVLCTIVRLCVILRGFSSYSMSIRSPYHSPLVVTGLASPGNLSLTGSVFLKFIPSNLAPSPQGQMRVFLPSQVMRMHSSCFLRCPGLVKNGLRDDLRSLFVLEICYIKTGLEVYLTLCNDDFFHEGELNSVDHRVVKTWHPRSSK